MKSKRIIFRPVAIQLFLTVIVVLLSGKAGAQGITALPNNGTFTQQAAPQPGLRFQRELYLITPAEMKASGITSATFNSIGFTTGVAQDSIIKGKFKLYLQNTTDTVSRIDTNWTYVTSATNSFYATGLNAGNYEWQITSACATTPVDTASAIFSTDDKNPCKRPTSFSTDSITDNSAFLTWVAPSSSPEKYVVQYRVIDSVNWVSDTIATTFYKLTGLKANKYYQWRVQTLCSGSISSSLSTFDNAFTTINPYKCNNPTGLTAGGITDNSAVVAWSAATGATYYSVQYRRVGSAAWASTISTTAGVSIKNLRSGTTYQWQVATVCAEGSGIYKTGPQFTTTGTTQCYSPGNLSTDSITATSAKLTWTPLPGVTSYNIRYRLKQSISWVNAINGMTPIHVVKDSITIPNVTGLFDIPFAAANNFSYTGNGIYVAWEYTHDSTKISSLNTSLANTKSTPVLSLATRNDFSDTVQLPVLTAISARPETRFGSSVFNDVVEVSLVYALGFTAVPFGNPTPISALIKNYTSASKTFSVTLQVKDAETKATRYFTSQNFTVRADTSEVVIFAGWSPTLLETDSIIVSVASQTGETVTSNNTNFYLQNITANIMAYDNRTSAITSAGFDTLSGLLLTRYSMNGCGKINSAKIFLSSSAKGHPLYAVLLNQSGTIISTSSSFTPDSSQVNNYHTFYFSNQPVIKNADYYVGLAQAAANPGYFPVGVQYENGKVRSNAYYTADLAGTNLKDSANKGRLMIRAEVIAALDQPVITGKNSLCIGATDSLMVSSKSIRFADSVLSFSSQRSNGDFSTTTALGSPDVYPKYSASPDAWVSNSADAQRENIVLKFSNAAPINYVDVYETYNPGAVDTVFLKKPDGTFEMVYSTTAASAGTTARINHITFPLTSYNVSEVRLALNSPAVSGFNSIDAVGIGQINNAPTYTSYLWSPGGATTQKIYITTANTYTVTVNNIDGCSLSDSFVVKSPAQTLPVISTNKLPAFCIGDSVMLTSNQPTGNVWSTGATTQSIFVKTGGSYFVSFNDGCGIRTSASVTVTVNPLPVVNITGTLIICSGSAITLDAGVHSSYLWSTGATTQTITTSAQGIYSVTVTNSNGCVGSASVFVDVAQSPVPVITGNRSFCPGGSTTLDAGVYSSYLWSTSAGTKSINVNAAGTYSVLVTDAKGCTGSTTATTSFYAAPVPVITGTLSFCASTATTLDAGSQYNNYLWTTGATSHSISVNTAGTFGVTVTDNNGCVGSASATTNSQGSLPQTPGPISGPVSTLCNTTGNGYTISPVSNTTFYVWTVPQGATITAGQGTTSITVTYSSSFTSGNIIVAASNACGQSPSLNPRTLLVQAVPSQPGNITGTITQLCSTQKTYYVAAVAGATSYTWSVSGGATIVSDQGGLSITVLFPSSFVSGSICVKANSTCGSSTTNCITVTGPPSTPGAISGIYSVCSRQKNVVYTVPLLPGATSYTWAVPSQATIVSGQGSNTISVTFGVKTGNITVKASNSCGSSALQTLAINMNCTGANAIATVAVALAAQPVRLVTKISVYPNPSTGRITLEFIRLPSLTYQVSVLDVLGQSVYSQVLNGQGNSVTLDLAHLRKGVYLLRLFNGYSYKEVTIVIQ